LHWRLEGEAILVRDIPKLNIPQEYFSNGTIAQSLGEATKDYCPLDTSFSIWGGLFFPHTIIKNVIIPLGASSLKLLEDHLLHLKEFSQMVGNISNFFS
jgi:hypothetical protein